jgi:fructokinase
VGNDRIGNYIRNFLAENGVDNKYVVMFEDGKSALALAFLNEAADAEYDFYKDYPNQRLNEEMPHFMPGDYLLFGSFYGLNPALRPQITGLLDAANHSKALVYYDPNFRSGHLASLQQLKSIIEENVSAATIVRASDEDMFNIYGVTSAGEAWEKIAPRCAYFVYTANAHGVDLFTPSLQLHVDVDRIEPVSTVGAGDTFNAGILYGLYTRSVTRSNIDQLGEGEWRDILQTAAGFSREVCLSFDNYVDKRV